MARTKDADGSFYGGYEPAIPESRLEDNHATKNGGPELAEIAGGIKGSYGGKDMATPECYYEANHSSVAGKIDKADE